MSANPKSVAIVVPTMTSGGAERVVANLANAWAARGRTVTVVSLASRSLDFYPLDPRVQRRALEVAGLSAGIASAVWANVQRLRALRGALRALAPDAVLAMLGTTGALTILATRGLPCRVVVSERTYPPMLPLKPAWDLLRRLTYPHADRVVMQTSEGLGWLRARIPGARGVVIPNPVSYPLPRGEPVLAPQAHLPPGSRLLLAVGRLDAGKHFEAAIGAFAALAPRFPGWRLVILGEGPLRATLERQVVDLGLGARVTLPGRVGNVADWYERAALYVMSSRYEGFPNTLAEAMAHGCPVVSYDCETGPRDIVRPGTDGLLVRPVGDVGALAEALGTLMEDEPTRARMAARAVEVRSRFSTDSVLARWDEALGAGPGDASAGSPGAPGCRRLEPSGPDAASGRSGSARGS